jgi:RHS repeat-associated protein
VVYVYDAEGRRVGRESVTTTGSLTCDPTQAGAQMQQSYLLGPGGQEMTMVDASGTWQWTNVYAAGHLIATYDTRGLHFHLTDRLGTRRVQTDYQGWPEMAYSSLPFGDDLTPSQPAIPAPTADDATPLHFTGKERDTESGNDYFGARYYSSAMGRFLSPDYDESGESPEPVPYAALDDPQTLNLYGYVQNNPLATTDPNGHVPCSGKATITITVTPTGSSMSQSPDDCPTTMDLFNFWFNPASLSTQRPPQTTQIPEMRPMSTPLATMSANTTFKQESCAKQALLAVGKNAIGYDLMSSFVNKTTSAFDNWEGLNYPDEGGNSGPSLPSSPGESAVNDTEHAAGIVATSSAAQQALRAALKSEGVKVSARAVGSTAEAVGKDAGYLGAAYTLADAVRLYNPCMSQ